MKQTKSTYVQPRSRVITLKDGLLVSTSDTVHESFGRSNTQSVEWEDESEL